MRTSFDNWWYSQPSYRDADKLSAKKAWDAAFEFSNKQKSSAERIVPLIREPNNEHSNSRWRDIL